MPCSLPEGGIVKADYRDFLSSIGEIFPYRGKYFPTEENISLWENISLCIVAVVGIKKAC